MVKNPRKIKRYWEVMAPEPFTIDSSIKEEDFLGKLIEVVDDDIVSLMSESLQSATHQFVINCSIDDLYTLFDITTADGFKCHLEEVEGALIISVENSFGEYVGRGEIIKLGSKLPLENVKGEIEKHMIDFGNRLKVGTDRMNLFMYKAKSVKNQLNSPSNQKLS